MKRRSFLAAGCAGLGCSLASRVLAQPSRKVSAGQLQRAVDERFPLRYPVGDLFTLDVGTPRLRMLPELNRLSTELALQAEGPALRQRYSGSFEVEFGLRYEPGDRTLRGHQLRVHSFRLPGLAPQALMLLETYGQALAQQALLEVVLYRLESRDLALPDAMGLQVGDITVLADGLLIGFVAKPARPES